MIRIPTARPSLLRLNGCSAWAKAHPGQAATTSRGVKNAAKAPRQGVKSHWHAETLRTTEKYPLSMQLLEKAHPETEESRVQRGTSAHKTKSKSATSRHARTQIVSPDLCGTSSLGWVLPNAC